MKKTIKIIALSIGILLTLVVLLGGIYIWMLSEAFSNTYGDSEEELNSYANSKMGRKIDVLARTERKWGKHRTKEVKVKTADREGIEFTIQINRFGETAGDDFDEQLGKSDFKEKYRNSPEIQKLQNKGFIQPEIGIKTTDRDLSMGLPSKVKLSEEDSFELILQALPVIQQLNEKVTASTGYPLEELYVDGEMLDLTKDYETTDDIGKQLAAENITIFYPNFYAKDKGEIQEVLYEVADTLFEISWKKPGLTCLALENYEACKSYQLTFTVDKANDVTMTYI